MLLGDDRSWAPETSNGRNIIFPGEVPEPKPNKCYTLALLGYRLHSSLQVYDQLSLFRAVCLLSLIQILFIKESQYTTFNGARYNNMLIHYVLIL